jgi:ferredoxin-NADP reductase
MNNSHLLTALVHAIRLEAQGIISIELRSPDGGELPPFEAGAHIDLHLANGMIRSYSLFNPPAQRDRYAVGVLNDPKSRGGSRFIHEHLRVGQTLQISAPRNHFKLDESAANTVLIGGGIGVTPVFCMYNRLRAIGKPVQMLYCARTRKEAAFVDELLASDGLVKIRFDDEAGGPPNLSGLLAGHAPDTHFYCCGPTPMLDAFEAACKQLGYDHVHIERFSAAGEVVAVQADGYQVELARSGKTVDVPSGKSLLDALLETGYECDHSCREGVCGACEVAVLEGEIDHRDSVLTAREREAGKTMMVCVSGCKGKKLVLDL